MIVFARYFGSFNFSLFFGISKRKPYFFEHLWLCYASGWILIRYIQTLSPNCKNLKKLNNNAKNY